MPPKLTNMVTWTERTGKDGLRSFPYEDVARCCSMAFRLSRRYQDIRSVYVTDPQLLRRTAENGNFVFVRAGT